MLVTQAPRRQFADMGAERGVTFDVIFYNPNINDATRCNDHRTAIQEPQPYVVIWLQCANSWIMSMGHFTKPRAGTAAIPTRR